MSEPLVSVITCVYNAGSYLRDSVQSILAQTYKNFELVIIDDGSTDGCMNTIVDIKDERIRVFHQPNKGKAAALNLALEKVQGKYYAIHDADDYSYPQRLAWQVAELESKPDLAGLFTGHDITYKNKRFAPRFTGKTVEQCRQNIVDQMRMPAHDPTVMYRVDSVRDFRYNEQLVVASPMDYILRVGEQLPLAVLGRCAYSYRIHESSLTRKDPALRREMVEKVLTMASERRDLAFEKCFPQLKQNLPGHRDTEEGLVSHCMESVIDLKRTHKFTQAFSTALTCWRIHPVDIYYAKPLFYVFAPLFIIYWYRKKKQ